MASMTAKLSLFTEALMNKNIGLKATTAAVRRRGVGFGCISNASNR